MSAATTMLGQVKCFCTQEVPLLDISNNEILYYTLKRNFKYDVFYPVVINLFPKG